MFLVSALKVAGDLEAANREDDENEYWQKDAQKDSGGSEYGESCQNNAEGIKGLSEGFVLHNVR